MTRPASPFAPPPPKKVRIRSRKDPVTAEVRAYVLKRDGGCVAWQIIKADPLAPLAWCEGPLEIDHVRASGGLGIRSPSTPGNLVTLCSWHHKAKTEYGRVWRPLLLAYLERTEVGE